MSRKGRGALLQRYYLCFHQLNPFSASSETLTFSAVLYLFVSVGTSRYFLYLRPWSVLVLVLMLSLVLGPRSACGAEVDSAPMRSGNKKTYPAFSWHTSAPAPPVGPEEHLNTDLSDVEWSIPGQRHLAYNGHNEAFYFAKFEFKRPKPAILACQSRKNTGLHDSFLEGLLYCTSMSFCLITNTSSGGIWSTCIYF